jgi:serine/threonine protein kinase
LKPENILINNFGDVKVSDFGTLMQLEGADSHINLAAGTIQFLAPERVQRTYTHLIYRATRQTNDA